VPDDDDAPEPEGDRSAPTGDPNAPRPPGDIPARPGQLVGSNGTYENPHADTPQTSRDYRDSGRTDYPQGRPGIDFRTARQAGIEPQFRTGDINTGDLDARLIANINRLLADPRTPQYVRDELTATSGYRPAHRGEAIERGMDQRLSQESVRSRANPVSGRGFPAGRPGYSNHGPGRAIDFQPGRALDYVRAHAREYGLETLGFRNGRPFDEPHIQLRGARGVAENRPSAQEQQAQRALDAQNRQAAIDRGLIAPGRGPAPTQQAAIPMPRGRPSDAPQQQAETEQQPPAPEQQPVALPPDAPVDVPAPLPPADIPAPAPFMGPPRAGRADPHWQAERAQSILKDATKGLNKDSGQAAFQAASVVAAKALAAAGIPVDMARSLMTKGALDGAIANGYGPGGPNSTVMGISIWGKVQSTIAEGVNAALQGYNPNATGPTPQGGRYGPGPVQGPFGFQPDAPAAPGKRSEVPFGTFMLAGLSQAPGREPVAGEPATAYPEDYGRPGDVGAREPIFQGTAPTIEQLSPITAPPARGPMPQGPEMQPMGGGLQANNAAGWQQALLDLLSQLSPISTAEARGARGSRGAEVRDEPTHDASVVAGRLTDARANLVADLRTNQGLLNLFDLIATMEVGSQGKAAVLAFVEMQMNRAAAEARAEGRQATGKDLARLLNDRTNYAESWGKIDAGKGKTGALTGDVFADAAEGSNTSKGSTGNASARVGFGGNPANAKIGNERFGTENYASHNAWYQSLYGPPIRAEIIGGPEASPASVFTAMPQAEPVEARAEGGPVDKGRPYVVGEEGPEYFVPDEPGTILPHMPQPGRGDPNIGRWPKVTAPDYPGRYRGLEGGIKQATRNAQDPAPGLMEMIDSERMRLNQANWRRMLSDPRLIALGRSQMEDRRDQPPAGRLPTDPPWGYIPDPSIIPEPPNEMSQQLGYDAIRRPPPRTIIGNRRY
jgi:hypothetical protein